MASPAQTLANTQNAQRSTGPNTTAGKAASSLNAAKHNLSSAFRVLIHESQAEFDTLLQGILDEYRPDTQHQTILAEQIARSWWLLARAQRLESKAFDILAGFKPDPSDPDNVILIRMYESNPNLLATIQRYTAQAERSHYKALRELKAAKQVQNEADSPATATSDHAPNVSSAPARPVAAAVQPARNTNPAAPPTPLVLRAANGRDPS